MIVSRIIALAACAGLCLGAMNAAQASFVLTLSLGGTDAIVSDGAVSGFFTDSGLETTAMDGNIADPGLVTYNASIGSFTVTVTTGVSKPVIGPGRIDLNSIQVSGGTGILEIGLTDTDYSGSASLYNTGFGGTTDGTVSFDFLYDSTNAEFGGASIDSFNDLTNNFSGDTTNSVGTLGDPYSLTILATIEHTGAGQITSFDAIASPVVAPVPAAVWLFGSGLLGLIGMAKRKKA